MAASRLPFRIRIGGWVVSLVGVALLVFSGGYSGNPAMFVAGVFSMILGMILTSTSSLVATLQYRRFLRDQAAEAARDARGGPPATGEAADPSPEKT